MGAESGVLADIERIVVGVVGLDAARAIVRRIQADLGGQQVCIPRTPRVSDAEIREALRGASAGEVIRAMGITRTRLYRALRAPIPPHPPP